MKLMLQGWPVFEDGYITANVSAGRGDLILFLQAFPEFWYTWKNQTV